MAHRIAVRGPGAVGHAPDAAAAESAASLSAKTYAGRPPSTQGEQHDPETSPGCLGAPSAL